MAGGALRRTAPPRAPGITYRFGELKRHVSGVSEKVPAEVPPRVEYSLTDLGQALNTALLPLGAWGDTFTRRIVERKEQALEAERAAESGPEREAERAPEGAA